MRCIHLILTAPVFNCSTGHGKIDLARQTKETCRVYPDPWARLLNSNLLWRIVRIWDTLKNASPVVASNLIGSQTTHEEKHPSVSNLRMTLDIYTSSFNNRRSDLQTDESRCHVDMMPSPTPVVWKSQLEEYAPRFRLFSQRDRRRCGTWIQ